ncbi:MAG: DNA repair protein RecO [Actinomycetota bacterium]|nr:DNA repair protein RecO [Actinomycetota bacterium]
MASFRDQGVVLRTTRLGEADRIITLITPEHGKVRAVAKGVRKTKSKLAGSLDLVTHVSLACWKGRELDVITQADVIDVFRAIREDLDKMPVAFTMIETVDHVALERHPMPELFKMLVGALSTLASEGGAVLLGAFLWKLLALEGVSPVVDRCTSCGEPAELVAFDESLGGFLCRSCRSGQAVTPEAVTLVRQILGGRLRQALAEPPSRATAEVERLATLATEYHLDRRLRSAHTGSPSLALPRRATTLQPGLSS